MKRSEEKLNKSFDELLNKYDEELKEIKSDYKKTKEEIENKLVSEFKVIEEEKKLRERKQKSAKKKKRNKKIKTFFNSLTRPFKLLLGFIKTINKKRILIMFLSILIFVILIILIHRYTIAFDWVFSLFKYSESPAPNNV